MSKYRVFKSAIYVPYIKRDGTAMIKISSKSNLGVGKVALKVTNETFSMVIDGEKDPIPY